MRLGPVDFLGKAAILGASLISLQRTTQAQDNKNQAVQNSQEVKSAGTSLDNLYTPVFFLQDSKVSKLMGSYEFNEPPNARWEITETYRYDADKELTVYPSDIEVEYEGQSLSNSTAKPHSIPKNYRTEFKLSESSSVETYLIKSSNDKQKCKERVIVQILKFNRQQSAINEIENETPPAPGGSFINPVYSPLQKGESLILKKGDQFQIRYIYEHIHVLYDKYYVLHGIRNNTLSLGPHKIYSSHNLNTDLSPMNLTIQLSKPSKERLFDTEDYRGTDRETISGRKGKFLYLVADIPGFQYFRFEDVHVKYGYATTFRLRFKYCIADGTEGTCHVRIMEYQDSPDAWKMLKGGFDAVLGLKKPLHLYKDGQEIDKEERERLYKILVGIQYPPAFEKIKDDTPRDYGRWKHFDCTFKTLDDTTTIALDFRIIGTNEGEMWIDDLELAPVYKDNEEGSRKEKFIRPKSLATETESISITNPNYEPYQISSLPAKASRKKASAK